MADVDLQKFASGAWVNPPGGVVGAALASSATITLTSPIHHVTGTTAISTIVPPVTGFLGRVTIIADGAFTLTTGGTAPNAVATVVTCVSGQAMDLVHDGVTWYPKIMD
jgi:hypothetical protein